MSRYSFYIRFVMVLAILATLAVAAGTEPWGPI